MNAPTQTVDPEAHVDPVQNRVLPFQVEALDIRGKAVTLTSEFDALVARHAYPEAVNMLLGQCAALTTLLGTTLKFDGKFILQTQSDGPVDLLVVEYRTPGTIRAYARFDAQAVATAQEEGRALPHELLGKGVLAMTVDQGRHMNRYQGIVALDGSPLEGVAHQYFLQSEQIPTRVRLAVGRLYAPGSEGTPHEHWRVGGIMAQFLPESEERMRLKDLPGGDGAEPDDSDEDDSWLELRALMDTVEDAELVDPDVSSERLLFRLFNQHDIRLYEQNAISEKCSCSREAIETVLANLSAEERAQSVVNGQISVACEFCGRSYEFDPARIAEV